EQKEEITFEDKSIIVNDLLFHNGILWCATQHFGVLGYQNGEFTHEMSVGNKIESYFVDKIEEKNDTLYVSHKEGFKILDLKTLKTKTLGTAEGVIDGSARDFAIGDGRIWYISNDQLFSTSTNNGISEVPDFKLSIDSLIIANKRVDMSQNTIFDYNENQLQCYISFSGIPYEKESILKYKLKGFDEEWSSVHINTNVIDYKFLPSGDYQLEVIAVYRDFVSKPIRYSFKIQKAFWLSWWFILCSIIFSIGTISALFLYRLRITKAKSEKQLEDQVLKANIIEIELKALRSQMNPHFIFNSLNSIQDLILQQDTNASYDYIVLFSDLVRNTLNYSNKNFIPLEKEVEFLETYLKLEKLRFDESFKCTIETENLNDISIPSLILQPFVENAIIHGLFHKSGSKELSIVFKIQSNYIHCSIIDNGIGRKKAQSILKRQGKTHVSFALNSIQKRLDILKNKYGSDVGYTIIDLGTAAESEGTRVDITLPFLD
ncbi:MAG: sensor histidine kinase, partial [Winogradskyella sp.]|uniref:sensor histidine kinase n=1 Tax=Winogradskyella sp. TaxID=1883156 RepID=UPI0038590334